MAAFVRLEIELDDETQAILLPKLVNSGARDKRRDIAEFQNLLAAVVSKRKRGIVRMQVGSAYATQTITCDYDTLVLDTDEVTIGPQSLLAATTPADEDEFAGGSDDATLATNLAAAINAHSVLSTLFSASAAAAVVTIKALQGGILSNEVVLSETGTSFTLGAAAPAGGAASTLRIMDFGHTR